MLLLSGKYFIKIRILNPEVMAEKGLDIEKVGNLQWEFRKSYLNRIRASPTHQYLSPAARWMRDLLDGMTRGRPDVSCSLRSPSHRNPRSRSDCYSWILRKYLSFFPMKKRAGSYFIAGRSLVFCPNLQWISILSLEYIVEWGGE